MLTLLASASTAALRSPHCGAFMAGVLPNCSVVKMLDNTFPEYCQPLPLELCTDVAAGAPHVAIDRGSPWFGGTGNASYLFITSTGAKFIHQIFMDKSDAAPKSAIKAQMPAAHGAMVGMRQASHETPLLVVTTQALYAAPSQSQSLRAVSRLCELTNLSLRSDARLTARAAAHVDGPATLLYVVSGDRLHTITVHHFGPTSGRVSIVTALLAADLEAVALEALPSSGVLLALLQTPGTSSGRGAAFRLATLNVTAAAPAYTPIDLQLPFTERPTFTILGIGFHFFVAAGKTLYGIFVEPPSASGGAWTADVDDGTPFEDASTAAVLGGVQYFV